MSQSSFTHTAPRGHLLPQLADIELIHLAQHGDKQAAGELLARHRSLGLSLARRIVHDDDLARELAQEATLAAYLSLKSLRQPERFASWFYGIVLNVCRSHLRTRHADPLSFESLQGGVHHPGTFIERRAPDPHAVVEARELHDLIMAAIHSLSDKNREATLLFYFQQLSLREIATLLGISVTAVKGRLHKSRRQLRDYLTATPTGLELVQSTASLVSSERKTQMIRAMIVDVIPPEDNEEGFKKYNYCVLLADEARSRLLSIWLGAFEGWSIAAGILKTPIVPRPMTYEFIVNLLNAANAKPAAVHISAIEENAFYATVILQTETGEHEIDARPSDALALAVRYDCPIYIAPEVMEKAGQPLPDDCDHDSLGKGFARYETLIEENRRLHDEYMEEIKKRVEGEEEQSEE